MDKSENEEQIDLDKLIRVFIKIRDRRAVNQKEFDTEDDRLKKQQEEIKAALLKHCVAANVSGAKAESGSFARITSTNYWVSDWEAMHTLVRDKAMPELLQKRLSQENLKTYLEENPNATIKGLETNSKYTISVRKGKK
tara:strand:+ start:83 stop:499 length:417 start_codon:yes stop_codon:yes gene_type:complete